ncbi:hypothetical protein DPMN_192491 [Dreissena polymorpha]|uniref:Uncharacterized protein n=1 Tax=Dreissena polymorpha TaxID=45954 RepID=A0A9D4BBQ5_DREPO|nr:hypothetical protein DPMN_192491 [Dreissena polymorpha]
MFIAHKNVTERDAVPNTDRMQCASMTKHVVFEHMLVSTKTMLCLLCLEDTFGSEGLKADMNRKKMLLAVMGLEAGMNRKANIWVSIAHAEMVSYWVSIEGTRIRVTGLHMEEDFHLCDTSLQKQVEGQMSSSTDVFLGGSSQTVSTSLSCSEGKEEDFNKESLLQLSSLNKLVTEKKFSSCVLTVATSWADLPELDCGLKKIVRRGIGYKIQTLLLDECSLLLDVSGLLPGEQ